jgi:hypothetical protein
MDGSEGDGVSTDNTPEYGARGTQASSRLNPLRQMDIVYGLERHNAHEVNSSMP